MTTSTIEEITAIAEPYGFEVPLQEPLLTGPTHCADTRLLEDLGVDEPVFGADEPVFGHWSKPGSSRPDWSQWPQPAPSEPPAADTVEAPAAAEEPTACKQGPLLPEEIANDLPPDSEIYHQAVGAFHAHLVLAGLAAVGLLAGVTVAVALAL